MPKSFSVSALLGSVFNFANNGSAFLSAMRFMSSRDGAACGAVPPPMPAGIAGAPAGAAASVAAACGLAVGADPRTTYPTSTPIRRHTAAITYVAAGVQLVPEVLG